MTTRSTTSDRVIRVFVSSTFRDMQAEFGGQGMGIHPLGHQVELAGLTNPQDRVKSLADP